MEKLNDNNIKTICKLGELKNHLDKLKAIQKTNGISDETLLGLGDDGELCIKPIYDEPKKEEIIPNEEYYGFLPRIEYFDNRLSESQTEFANNHLNSLRLSNDQISSAINRVTIASNRMKREVINEALDKIDDINQKFFKGVIDTIMETNALDIVDTRVNMIRLVNKEDKKDDK